MNTKYVYLGRFAPFHNGHQFQLQTIINEFGIENVLVLVGSANVINERTPYHVSARIQMIKNIFPEVQISTINDADPTLMSPDPSNNNIWLDMLETKLNNEFPNTRFIFIGGAKQDIEYLECRFECQILIHREIVGKIRPTLSATLVREMINYQPDRVGEVIHPYNFELVMSIS